MNKKITFGEFWDTNDGIALWIVTQSCPTGSWLADCEDYDDDEDWCDVKECLDDGLINTSGDHYTELVGEVDATRKRWIWDGAGRAWDHWGNSYYKIELHIESQKSQHTELKVMRIEKREKHNVLYLSTGVQAIRLPATIDVKQVKQLLADLPPTTPSRRKKSIAILNENGIKAS